MQAEETLSIPSPGKLRFTELRGLAETSGEAV